MPLIMTLLPLLKQYSTHILVAWVGFAALWYADHNGYRRAKTEQAQEFLRAKIITQEKEKVANAEIQKIADDFIADIGYGLQPTSAGMPETARNTDRSKGCIGGKSQRIYEDKVATIDAAYRTLEADRKLCNGEQ